MKKLMSILLVLAMLAASVTVLAEAETAEVVCAEENIATRIPAGMTARYEEGTGLMIYARSEGKIPYVIVSRRSQEMKFKNPENYLNNVFREYMEDKYGNDFLGMNPATVWKAGGKELLGARYMYMVGDTRVTLLLLLEIRDGGDVEYTTKFTDDTEEITMDALNTAVEYYRETDIEAPVSAEKTEAPVVSVQSGTVPAFLIPSEFVARFNSAMEALADQYAETLGADNVQALKDYYTFTEKDPQGSILYFGTKDWEIEAAFYFPDDNEPTETMPARIMNIAIKKDTPETAATIAKRIFELLVSYEYQNEVSADELHSWFDTVSDPSDAFAIPGHMLVAVFADEYTQYAVLPEDAVVPAGTDVEPAEDVPQGSADKTAVWDDSEWADFHCEEDGFTTKKPYHALTQYKNDKGYTGIAFYLDVPGYPPYVLVHRRSMEMKFKNPENYLNNTYREFLEDKFDKASVGTNLAKIWEIGGKQLIGAKYLIKFADGSETTQIQLIEVRDLGDVEYTVMYDRVEDEALAMKALEAAVANYAEDEAQKPAATGSGASSRAMTAAEERRLLTIGIDDGEYVLGESTPRDLVQDGWDVSVEQGGTIVCSKSYRDGMVFVKSEKNAMDKPILMINAMWADDANIEYCGFDGIINPGLAEGEDPDQVWNREYPYEILVNAWEMDDIHIDPWGAMCNWLVDECGAKQSDEGIYETEITLSDGRTLYISSHDSPVCISLIPD